jgi:hypothetical protein
LLQFYKLTQVSATGTKQPILDAELDGGSVPVADLEVSEEADVPGEPRSAP